MGPISISCMLFEMVGVFVVAVVTSHVLVSSMIEGSMWAVGGWGLDMFYCFTRVV